ncbi:MAG: acetate/propionate family kinase [Gaiellales bacterium]
MAVLSSAGDILVVNAGSTSLKLHLVDRRERSQATPSLAAVSGDGRVAAVAHRVVHGGDAFVSPVVVDEAVRARLEELEEIAPLHNLPALRALDEARERFPSVPQVAVFDTAFHAAMPPVASTYAVPRRWRDELHVRRYGFHGLSLEWALERSSSLLERDLGELRLVVCHLGGGCSVTAIAGGRSRDTTMGFSPLEGVPMASRSGSVDPGALLYLLHHGETTTSLGRALNEESGLTGLAGTGSVAELERRAEQGDDAAGDALELLAYRVAGAASAMAMAAGGIDALVFTAGVGEGSAAVREAVCGYLGFLGVEIDRSSNGGSGDRDVARPGTRPRVLVVHAREEIVAARATRELLAI